MKNRRFYQLDGLRGLAAMVVLVHHFWPGSVRFDPTGGRIGVDLFFALSGFLITRSLMLGQTLHPENPWSALRSFHRRRVQRIFPVFYLTLLLAFLVLPHERSIAWIWHASFLSNVYFILKGHYVGAGSHLWALAVEQQYYLFWPLIVLFLPRRYLRAAVLGMIGAGLLFRLLSGIYHWPAIVFDVATPGAFEALGCGALLALALVTENASHLTSMVSIIGILGGSLLLLRVVLQNTRVGPAMTLLTTELSRSLLLTWVIAQAAREIPGVIGHILKSTPMRALGAWSYAIYVSHNFFLTLAYSYPHGILISHGAQVAAALFATFVWSGLCYHFLEKPLLSPSASRQNAPKTL